MKLSFNIQVTISREGHIYNVATFTGGPKKALKFIKSLLKKVGNI